MIYTRIDTYSCILYNTSIKSIIEHLLLPTDSLSSIYESSYAKHDVQIGDTFVFIYFGVRIECKLKEYQDKENRNSNILENEFSWLRLYLSGDALNYITNETKDIDGFDISTALCDVEYWLPISTNCRVTRCDFAFDFVNYVGNEFERLRKIVANADFDENLSDKGRLYTGTTASLTYSYRGGKERTIYLGSTSADRMLRIYDKKYQLTDSNGIFSSEKVPVEILKNEISIDSWYRIELQTRDNFSERYLYSCGGNFRFIMGEISSFFDVQTREGKRIAPLHKIFLWSERTPIIQNANSMKPKKELEIVSAWVEGIASSSIKSVIYTKGLNGLIELLNDHTKNCIHNGTKEQRMYFLNKERNRLATICEQEGIKIDTNGNINEWAYIGDDGGIYIRDVDRVILNSKHKGPYSQNE